MKIVLASNNVGKLKEIQTILQPYQVTLIPQSELNVPEVPETGLTFVENALIKARHAAKITGLPALADDSGICLNALKGAPGIYSARFAGNNTTSEQHIEKLLYELERSQDKDRGAYFFCTIVLMHHDTDPTPLICQGQWHGTILNEPQGNGGFGYDPIFRPNGYECAAAELARDEKNRISHRGQALGQLIKAMQSIG